MLQENYGILCAQAGDYREAEEALRKLRVENIDLQISPNKFGKVRTVEISGEPWLGQ